MNEAFASSSEESTVATKTKGRKKAPVKEPPQKRAPIREPGGKPTPEKAK
jgi:hypothetical protein